MDQDIPEADGARDATATDAAAQAEVRAAPTTIGGQLRAAREAQAKSLVEISGTTKIPARLLDALERMELSELPSGPYASGFVRTYARTLGLDAEQILNQWRAATHSETIGSASPLSMYEPVDAARVPPSKLVWLSLGIAVLIAAGYGIWRSEVFTGIGATPVTADAQAPQNVDTAAAPQGAAPQAIATPEPTVTIAPTAPVLISATGPLYFSLEDANGRAQFDLTLNGGEFYTVKQNQRSLFLRTPTPQSLKLVVDGTALPPIGTAGTPLSGVGLDAPSLSRIASGQWVQPVAPATPVAAPPPR